MRFFNIPNEFYYDDNYDNLDPIKIKKLNNFVVLPSQGKVAMKEVSIMNDLKLVEFPNLLDGQLYNNIPFIHNNYFTFVGRVGYDEFGQSFILNENQNYSVDTYNIYNLDINRYNELNDTNYVGFKSINLALKNMTYSASQDNFITETTYNYNIMRLAMNNRDIQLGCFGILNPVEFWQDNHTTFKIALNAANLIISAVDPGTLGTIASTITNNVVQKTTTRHYPSPDPDHPGESPGTEMKNRIEITVDVLDYFETTVNSFPYEFDIEQYNTIHQSLHAGVRKIKLYAQGGTVPQLESNIVITNNGEYILGNNDADDELEIYQNSNNRSRSLPASIGTFIVNVPAPTPSPIVLNNITFKDGSNRVYSLTKRNIVEDTSSGVHSFNLPFSFGFSGQYRFLYLIGVNYKADPCTLFAKRIRASQVIATYNLTVKTTATIFGMYYLTTSNDTDGYFQIEDSNSNIFYLSPSRYSTSSTATISETFNLEPRASYSSTLTSGGFSVIDIPSNNKIEADFGELFENV